MKRIISMMTAVVFIILVSFSLPKNAIAATSFVKGIDVSTFQGTIDWNSVANSGIDFAIVRCATTKIAEPAYIEDSKFSQNYSGAKSAGIKVGTYMYTSAASKSEMKSNIEAMLSTIGSRKFDLPVYLDVEQAERQSKLGKTELTEILLYGCNLIESSGHKAGVYANYDWFKNYVNADTLRSAGYEIWLARYPSGTYAVNPSDYDFSDSCTTWQYSSLGKISGISGNVDLDIRYSMSEPNFNDYDYELDIPYPRPQCSSTHWLGDGTVGSVTGIKKGSEVGWLQTALNRAINAGLNVDCEIGTKTTDAIKNFQSKYGLTADGYAGEKTINKLVEVLKNQITLGTPLFSVITVKKPEGDQKGTVNISWYKTENATGYYIKVGSYSLGKSTDIDVGKATDYTFTYGKDFLESHDAQDIWLQLIAVNSTYGLESVSEKIDITLVPADPNKLTIHYNVSGGTLADDSEYYTASNGDIYRKSDNKILAPVWKDGDSHENGLYNASTFKMTRIGWHFLGWSRAKSNGTIFDQHDNTITATDIYPEIKNQDGTVTLYARWDENEYNVIFNANGGTTPTASKSVEYSKTYGNLPMPTRSGYTFNGWYTSASGGTKITADSKVTITSDQTLYAQWKAIPTTTTAPTTTASKITTTATAKVTTTVATTLPHLSVEEYEVSLSVKEQYVIKANQSDLTYKSDNEDVVIVSRNGVITAVGNGEAKILVTNQNADKVYVKVNVIFLLKGDTDGDGNINVDDAVMLQKWLLGLSDELTCWQNADLCEDGIIDVFDMIEMRKLLIQNK